MISNLGHLTRPCAIGKKNMGFRHDHVLLLYGRAVSRTTAICLYDMAVCARGEMDKPQARPYAFFCMAARSMLRKFLHFMYRILFIYSP